MSAFNISIFKKRDNIEHVWEDIIGVVVQPGVEFGNDFIHEYNREEAKELVEALDEYPSIVFEGHSTDYQTPAKLREMVEDGVAILKVGPGLSFALRECLFALAAIEEELMLYEDTKTSRLIEVLESTMLSQPDNWDKHYHGNQIELRLAIKYSFYDRARYYFGSEDIQTAIDMLFDNLRKQVIPLSLLSQFLPIQYHKIRKGHLENDPYEIALDSISNVLDDYNYAVLSHTLQGVKVKRRFYV